MYAPDFWWTDPSAPDWKARALAPTAALWRLGAAIRQWRARPQSVPVPVLCIGNVVAGGAGKTPLTAAIVRRLEAAGRRPHVLSRGYGGRVRGPHRVNPGSDRFDMVGDEPLTLAHLAPTWIARDRQLGAVAAAEAGAGVIVMDDGFQNPHLAKTASVLVVDAKQGFGNGRVIPAGPLREPVAEGVARADAVVVIGTPADTEALLTLWPTLRDRPVVQAEMRPLPTGLPLAGEPVVAFAGIGRPEKFFATLAGMGAQLLVREAFPDHHRYSESILWRLRRTAERHGAMLVTTEKDAVRLPDRHRRQVLVVQIALELADWSALDQVLNRLC
ncbi:MAG: tetraacyldisaccharide 4'-kinase [Pseudomonadota bacterium]